MPTAQKSPQKSQQQKTCATFFFIGKITIKKTHKFLKKSSPFQPKSPTNHQVTGLTSPRGVVSGVINGDGPGDAKEGGGERLGEQQHPGHNVGRCYC